MNWRVEYRFNKDKIIQNDQHKIKTKILFLTLWHKKLEQINSKTTTRVVEAAQNSQKHKISVVIAQTQ